MPFRDIRSFYTSPRTKVVSCGSEAAQGLAVWPQFALQRYGWDVWVAWAVLYWRGLGLLRCFRLLETSNTGPLWRTLRSPKAQAADATLQKDFFPTGHASLYAGTPVRACVTGPSRKISWMIERRVCLWLVNQVGRVSVVPCFAGRMLLFTGLIFWHVSLWRVRKPIKSLIMKRRC